MSMVRLAPRGLATVPVFSSLAQAPRALHMSAITREAGAVQDALLEERLVKWKTRLEKVMPEPVFRGLLAQSQASLTLGNIARSEEYHDDRLLASEDSACPAKITTPHEFAQYMAFVNVDVTQTHGITPIGVSLSMGKFLEMQARLTGARKVLEIGTLGGFSTLWLASGVSHRQGAEVITLELDPKHAQVAQANFDRAVSLGAKLAPIDLRVNPALESLRAIPTPSSEEAFDLIFVDADKESYPQYYNECKRLARSGAVVIFDNMGWLGKLANPAVPESDAGGQREVLRQVQQDGYDATTVHTVSQKSFDGFTMIILP